MFESRPNILPWPPMIYALAAILAWAIDRVLPLPWFDGGLATLLRVVGVFAIAVAIAIDIAALVAFRRHRTTILPNRAASHLITSGIFSISRNPIYVGNTLLLAGAGLALGIIWMVLAVPFAVYAVTKLAIAREEIHLAAKFGRQWTDYAVRTPRWLGSPRG